VHADKGHKALCPLSVDCAMVYPAACHINPCVPGYTVQHCAAACLSLDLRRDSGHAEAGKNL
jgi:hypothetical protein